MNFNGNAQLLDDPQIQLPRWLRDPAPTPARGKEKDTWALEQSIDRGYAVATFYSGDVVPDDKVLAALEGETEPKRPWEKREEKPALAPWNARLAAVYQLFQSTDETPVPQAVKAAEQVLKETGELLQRWEKLKR